MKKITRYVLLLIAISTMGINTVQSQNDLCDDISISVKRPFPFDENQIEFNVVVSELPEDVKPSKQRPMGQEGKEGTEYIMEVFAENGVSIKKNIRKPSSFNSEKNGKYTYKLSLNIKEYYQVSLKFTRKNYMIITLMDPGDPFGFPPIPPSPIGYQQMSNQSFCTYDNIRGGAQTPSGDRSNLTLKSFKIKKGTKTWDLMQGQTPTLSKDLSNPYEFTITVENNGKIIANDVRAWIGHSAYNKYPDPSLPAYGIYTHNYNSINSNSSKSQTRNVFVYDYLGSSPSLTNGRTYYLIVDIDPDGKVNESKENDNIWSFPFLYSKPPTRPTDPIRLDPLNSISQPMTIERPYEVQVYDIYGRRILTREVENKNAEETLINELSNGYYILKSDKGDRKIAKGL